MRRRSDVRIRTLLVGVAAWALLALPAVRADEPGSPWRDAAVLEKHVAEACDVVEAICGAKFAERPGVAVVGEEAMREALAADLAIVPASVLSAEEAEGAVQLLAPFAMGKYVHEGNRILVQPDAAERLESLLDGLDLGRDPLRVLLAHEAAHALDFRRFALRDRFSRVEDQDALVALGAVSEGHAQWVAEEAARRWEIPQAFTELTRAITGDVDGEDAPRPAVVRLLMAELAFPYAQGHAFMKAVYAARGREGLDAVLRDPPTTTRAIERPGTWLAGETKADQPRVDAAIEALRPLVGDEAWHVSDARLRESTLRTQAVRLPEERRAEFLRGFRDGRTLVAQVPLDHAQVIGAVLGFDTREDAALFVALERIAAERSEEQARPLGLEIETLAFDDGAGRDGSVKPGWSLRRLVKGRRGHEVPVSGQTFAVGSVVVEIVVVNAPSLDRAAVDEVVDYVVAILRDPQAAASLERPAPRRYERTTREVLVRVVGPEGDPVPRAEVLAAWGEGGQAHRWKGTRGAVTDGACRLVLPRRDVHIAVHGAKDASGKYLPLAPSSAFLLAAHREQDAVLLEPGRVIAGRVLDVDANPAADVRVRCLPADMGPFAGVFDAPAHGEAVTDAEGRFRIATAGPRDYELALDREEVPVVSERPRARGGDASLEIQLEPVRTVRITVIDPEGDPASRAYVALRPVSGGAAKAAAAPDQAGVAVLHGLAAGVRYDLEISVYAPPGEEGLVDFHEDDWLPEDRVVRLERGWTLRGVVHDARGRPAQAVVLRRRRHGWNSRPTAPDGTFWLSGLPPGPVHVAARPPRDDDAPPSLRPGEGSWTTFEPGAEDVVLVLESK